MKSKMSKGLCVLAMAVVAVLGLADSQMAIADNEGFKATNHGWFGWRGHKDRACARSQWRLNRNVKTVVSYYTLAFNAGEPELAVEKYVGVDENGDKLYIQHNPFAADGPEAFIAFVNFFKGMFPDLHVNIVRTIAQCDLVMTHSHITTSADDIGSAAADIFRLDATGRIVEHWDVVQPVEPNPANDNTMF